ncbi:putative ATP-dependent endonuclease of the OLDfamily YbjD subgroup [Salmonella enterica subsp. enterica]|nr:putative ATP-dependent endonuclease of the OLDfamily YbjD subgroup [Salmonella enterica subsp. enterica]
MILERVEIVGFRGINRLSLMLEQNNVLIGENAWGKSSLLDALTLLLSPELDLYHFVREDFLVSAWRHKRTRASPAYYSDFSRNAARAASGTSL